MIVPAAAVVVPANVAAALADAMDDAIRSAGIVDPAVHAIAAELAAVGRAYRSAAGTASGPCWVDVATAARMAGVKVRAMTARCHRGTVTAVQSHNGRWRIDAASLNHNNRKDDNASL